MSNKKNYATNVDRQGRVRRGAYIKSGECIFPFFFKKKVQFCIEKDFSGIGSTCFSVINSSFSKISWKQLADKEWNLLGPLGSNLDMKALQKLSADTAEAVAKKPMYN